MGIMILITKEEKRTTLPHCSIKERDNTSKVSKQRKQLIWNLKFHADTAAIFSQMNKTLSLQYHGIFCII